MAPLLDKTDAVKDAVGAVSTCTPAIYALLKELLQGVQSEQPSSSPNAKPPRPTAKSKPAAAWRKRPTTTGAATQVPKTEELPAKEKAHLASHIVNVALKALGDAAKAPPKPVPETPAKQPSRTRLRRSNSTPMTPLQPRHFNRVSTSPATAMMTNKHVQGSPSISQVAECLPLVECIRVAFATLRALRDSGKVTLPELQLESGMSSFISKLLQLGFADHATKELQILKKRLEDLCGVKETKKVAFKRGITATEHPSKSISKLLDFPPFKSTGPMLNMVIATQLHVLRLLAALKRSCHIEAALHNLRESHTSSPLNLASLAAKSDAADRSKCVKQLELLSQSILALCPGISIKDDQLALETRVSASPAASLELQVLALELRLKWWGIAGHKADPERDIFLPFSRCLTTYVRRSQVIGKPHYTLGRRLFDKIASQVQGRGYRLPDHPQSSLTTIHQILAISAQECGNTLDAVGWMSKAKEKITPQSVSAAKYCASTTTLLSLALKNPKNAFTDEPLCREVLDGLKGPLKGDSGELDELLQSVARLRKAAVGVLSAEPGSTPTPRAGVRTELKSLVLLCPRFILRWLGKAPESTASTRECLRYEQRRQALVKIVPQTIDATLWLLKSELLEEHLECGTMDSALQESLTLLEAMDDLLRNDTQHFQHVKISHIYYMHYNCLRRKIRDPKDSSALRALRKSVECVKSRPDIEKDKSQLFNKVERLVETCRATGRREEAVEWLNFVKKCMIDSGALASASAALSQQPPPCAWTLDDQVKLLSRSLTLVSKIEHNWSDWTLELPEPERAAVLEHWLGFIASDTEKQQASPSVYDTPVDHLLRIYTPGGFPVRRLRVLLHLMSMNLDNQLELPRIRTLTEVTMHMVENSGLGEDEGLQAYLPHLEALFISLTGVVDGYRDLSLLHKSLSTWDSAVSQSRSKTDLLSRIDNPSQLVSHLQSVADFLRLKGEDDTVTKALELSLGISRLLNDSSGDDVLDGHTSLILQYINLGASSKAQGLLDQTRLAFQDSADPSSRALANFHLSCAEFFLCTGSFDKAEAHLNQAREAATAEHPSKKFSRSRSRALVSHAFLLQSTLALENGETHHALEYGKSSLKVLYQDWSKLEKTFPSRSPSPEASGNVNTTASFKSSILKEQNLVNRNTTGPEFWALSSPMIRCLSWLASIHAHLGMFQEAIYYAEQAHTIAKMTQSNLYTARSSVLLSSMYARGSQLDKALDYVTAARNTFGNTYGTFSSIALACQISEIYRELKDDDAEAEMMEIADAAMKVVAIQNKPKDTKADDLGLETKMAQLTIKEAPKNGRARGHTRAASAATGAAARAHARKASVQKAKPTPTPVKEHTHAEDIQVSLLRGSLLVQQALYGMEREDWASAFAVLQQATKLVKLPTGVAQERVAMASCLIGESMDLMMRDPVFSVIPESALCFPAVHEGKRSGPSQDRSPSPIRKGGRRAGATQEKARSALMEKLFQAQEYLMEIHSTVLATGDRAMVKTVTRTLQNLAIMLAAACSPRATQRCHPPFATFPIDMGRNLLWQRDQQVLQLERSSTHSDETSWPMALEKSIAAPQAAAPALDLSNLARLRKDYADILPREWNVVSITIDAATNQLTLVNFVSSLEPMVIKAPIIRDGEEEFTFSEGRNELLDITARINESCHMGNSPSDSKKEGGKTKWWDLRNSLEEELSDLLVRVEQFWLGGFKGVFSQHKHMPGLLGRFKGALQGVLDNHLPSRQKKPALNRRRGGGGTAASSRAGSRAETPNSNSGANNNSSLSLDVFDDRVLELFVGLGDVNADPELDLTDELGDLLNFVTDILGWYGEQNARDEIDWDSMILDTQDALRAYHAAAASSEDGSSAQREAGRHTLLVLDPSLHVFPWESMGCMRNMAVSRIPSLAYLRDVLVTRRRGGVEQQLPLTEMTPPGLHVDSRSGAYILDPGADLPNTRKTFEKPLSQNLASKQGWDSVVGTAPTETFFAESLEEKDTLLYFGHGSGAQFIRGRTVRRIQKGVKSVALLMGCSSVATTYNGHFELGGPVWNLLAAGSPCVVGALWDVTDRDIDRFAVGVCEGWGILKGGGRTSASGGESVEQQQMSLVEAVGKARGRCKLRGINGGAVVVYGVPAYVSRD
ncbi:hypothetical protein MKZ38_006504 [Zalerion maritima]|uniref:separase n=1 Tax=Zalerion maritima TaxID=339359 RepID=A0AAD5WY56_9PEZI|nr:hypothetical protein MKZ38_006504 [Zalerion maritima]